MMKRLLLRLGLVCALIAVLWGVFGSLVTTLWQEMTVTALPGFANGLGALATIALGAAVLIGVIALKGRWWLVGLIPGVGRIDDLDFQRLRLAVWLGILSLPLLTFGLLALTLEAARQQALDQGQRQVRILSQVVAEQTTRTLRTIDLVLRNLALEMEMKRPDPVRDTAATIDRMNREKGDEPGLRSVWAVDRQGNVAFHTIVGGVGLAAADRAYFRHHLMPASSELYVGDLLRSLFDNSWFIPVSRRFLNSDGSLAGVVAAAWEPRHFSKEWAAVDVGPGGSVALFSDSGQLVMRTPYQEAIIGRSFADEPMIRDRVLKENEGFYRRLSILDGQDRVFAFRQTSGPRKFIVVVGMTVNHILEDWRQFTILSFAVWLVFTAALTIFGRILLEQINRRAADARRLRDIARFPEDNPTPILRIDRNGRVIYTNSAARLVIARMVDPVDQAALKQLIERAATVTTTEQGSLTIGINSFEAEITPLANTTVGLYLIDTTERLAAIRRLRKSEERLALAVEASGLGLFDLDPRSGRMIVNPRYALMLGYDPVSFEENVDSWSARLHPHDRDLALGLFRDCMTGRISDYQTEYRHLTTDGDWKWLLSIARIVERDDAGEPTRLVGTHMDITDRKLHERDRERNEALNKLLLSLSNRADQRTEHQLVASGLEGLCAITGSRRAGLHFVDDQQTRITVSIWHPDAAGQDDPGGNAGMIGDCLARRSSLVSAADGTLPTRSACVPVLKDDVVRVIIEIERERMSYDADALNLLRLFADHLWEIIQRQRAEQALRDSESRLKAMTSSTKDAIIMIDHEGLISFWNPAAETIFGYGADEAIGRDAHLFLAGETGPGSQQAWALSAQSQTGFMANRTREVFGYHKDGRKVPVEITVSTFLRGGLQNAVGVLRDITDRQEAEQQKWQAQKMDSLGSLAGGIAHDINNLLVPVLGMTESVLDKLPADSSLCERLELVMDASQQIKGLVERILTFSRKQGVQRDPLDIAQVVKDAIPLIRATTPASMSLVDQLDPATGIVVGDVTQLHAVLMNLASNAAHALEGRLGRLTIVLDRIIADVELARVAPTLVEGKSYAHLSIADNGCGMDARTMERMFDPFFTTREVGEGTGLGMAIVHGIITKHDGTIRVHSTPGQGTTFDIYLPINIPGRR
ncbi:two-component system, cell cycle sensor histidine kinase and response regulator CckA [uncultured Gammaproteobacteria bacterium]